MILSSSTEKLKIDRAVIEVNGGCNYTCAMCPQTSNDGRHGARGKDWLKKMSITEFERIVAECVEYGLRVVNLEGSGEPTLNNDLDQYIKIVKKYNVNAFVFSNGMRMQGDYMKKIVDAGIDFFRFSIIGYSESTYKQWMNSPYFNLVVKNLHQMQQYVTSSGSDCVVATYHLITNNDNTDFEKKQYLKIVNSAMVKTEIWKMHNWAGSYIPKNERTGNIKTCGRPFSPDIVIRAGGLNGKFSAVHPCCQVLGKDSEAVLGHLSDSSIQDVWFGNEYNELREQHKTGNYPSYCKGCDFLIDDPSVLIFTNYDRNLYKMHGTNFSLNDYRK